MSDCRACRRFAGWCAAANPIFLRKIYHTRKYPLRGYFLGVLSHTNAWDWHWGWDKTLEYDRLWLCLWNSDYVVLKLNIRTSASPRQQWSDWGLRLTLSAYFSLITHTKQLLLVSICYTTAGIGASFQKHGRTDGERTDGRKDRQTWKSK